MSVYGETVDQSGSLAAQYAGVERDIEISRHGTARHRLYPPGRFRAIVGVPSEGAEPIERAVANGNVIAPSKLAIAGYGFKHNRNGCSFTLQVSETPTGFTFTPIIPRAGLQSSVTSKDACT